MNDLMSKLPPMKSGSELLTELAVFPSYDEAIRYESPERRLMALSDIYNIYIPSQMSIEIYNRLYLGLLRSFQKKQTKIATQQAYQNHRAIKGQEYSGIIGGADSFTIIGKSGIGKSTAISRAITLITENRVIEVDNPYYTKIIPCICVQCPFDCSVKGLLLEILRKVDETLDSKFYTNAMRARASTDMLIGSVSQVALNHIGMLIVDEIQNVVNSKNGKSLIGALTQLLNNAGISVVMVGVPDCLPYFEKVMYLARRSVGLQYGAMPYDDNFQNFCKILFEYQYVSQKSETAGMTEWLYEHSAGGVAAIVVSLIHDAQEIAILTGKERLDLDTLNAAYEQRLSMLRSYIEPSVKRGKSTSSVKAMKNPVPMGRNVVDDGIRISALVEKSKAEGLDIVTLLKENHVPIVEVAI